MASTFNVQTPEALAQGNRYFTPSQLLAFAQTPNTAALKEVDIGGNKKAAYLEGEYIRLTLNRLIGPGQWELKTALKQYETGTMEKDEWVDRRKTGNTITWNTISAVVHTSLVFFARDGSEHQLRFEATTVGDGMYDPKKSLSDALDKAIKSAETDGLKRCAVNLGRVFGLDINNKVKNEALPKPLAHFRQLIEERANAASQTGQDTKALPAPAAAAPIELVPHQADDRPAPADPTQNPAAAAATEAAAPAIETDPTKPAEETPRVQTRPATAKREEQPAKPQEQKRQNGASQPRTEAPQRKQTTTVAEPATPTQGVVETAAAAPADTDWELSMTPSKFEEWLKCITTMARRINACANDQEIQNFIRRNQKLIDKLPIIESTDGKPARNFKERWRKVVANRYNQLSIPVPEAYLQAA